jgi:hypothetical protein
MTAPVADVLIPVHNAAETVRRAVASITAQGLEKIRILIVDDGSTDASPAILAELAAADPRIEVVRQDNAGIVGALNTGLARCSAEFLARFDADDEAYPERLERQIDYLKANPDCVAVGCDVDHIDELGAPLEGLPRPGPPEDADPDGIPAREPYLIHPYLVARRQAVLDAGGYRPVPSSEDSDLYWRLAERGRLHNLPERLGRYRMHAASISGASVLGGRVMAIGSQLGALSARRRRDGRADLAFDKNGPAALREAGTLEAMHALAAAQLDSAEADRLRLAAAIKLLELAAYRPYEPEPADCAFIRAALPLARRHPPEVQAEVRWHVTHAAARLMRKGRANEALALVPPALWPRVSALLLTGRT